MAGFDGITGTVAARVMVKVNADMEDAALRFVKPCDGERFFVIGFGPGVGLELLLDAVTPAQLFGVDPSAAMVSAARRRLARHPRGTSVELRQARVANTQVRETFDAAIAVDCEQFFEPHAKSTRVIGDALRPGTRLVSITHRWAIEKRGSLEDSKAVVGVELADAGFDASLWSEDRYRSGPAIGYVARSRGHHDG